jgi:class I fructose-bisphosphate aldolase
MFEDFRPVQEAARDHDLPIAMWSYPRGQAVKEHRSKEIIGYAARLGLELGSDFVKVKYPRSKENMRYAVKAAAGNRVLLSGGSKTSDRDFLELVEDCMDVGVAGLAVGRNVWQRENPYEMLDMLEEVVFEGESADDVL